MLVEQPRRRFSADEVLRMVETGILGEDEPVELLDGELVTVTPQGPMHRALAVVVHDLLRAAFGEGVHVQDHSPIAAEPYSLPEPDVAVIRGAARDFLERHASGADVVLAVEIS
ncbi:MAG: Uma2 family endonuclease, partial [Deltaproteobacteria bacterium]|nr:Uma2 family endonuclease [Deltaproteobacteria bacterium]